MITEADKQRFDEQGYLLVEGLVDEAHCQAVRQTICAYLGITEADPATWPRSRGHGVINLFHACCTTLAKPVISLRLPIWPRELIDPTPEWTGNPR